MNQPLNASRTMLAHPRTAALDDESSGVVRRRALLRRYGRAVTLGIALRHVRTALTQYELLAIVEEILVQHVGVDAFAIVDAAPGPPNVLASRGIGPAGASQPPLARVPLGTGDWALGALHIYRLLAWKDGLDVFDHELLAALGPQVAVALHAAHLGAQRPTVRPPRAPRSGEE